MDLHALHRKEGMETRAPVDTRMINWLAIIPNEGFGAAEFSTRDEPGRAEENTPLFYSPGGNKK